MTLYRVEHFVVFEKLVFTITSQISRILMEHVKIKETTDAKLKIDSLYLALIERKTENVDFEYERGQNHKI